MSEKLEILKDLDSVRERLSNLQDVVIIADDKYKKKWGELKRSIEQMKIANSVKTATSHVEGNLAQFERETKAKMLEYILSIMEEMESSYA